MKLPTTLKGQIDKLLDTQSQLQRLKAVYENTKEYKDYEKAKNFHTELVQEIISNNTAQALNEAKGRRAYLNVTERTNYTIEDWDTLLKFIIRRKAFDIFTRKITPSAVQEREQDGVAVPGLRKSVSITVKAKEV